MKRIISLVLSVVIFILTFVGYFSITSSAANLFYKYINGYFSINYTVTDGQVCITKVTGGGGEDYSIELPTTINGYPVTSIGDGAFRKSIIDIITIPEGITTIGDYVFADNYNDMTVNLPDSLTTMGVFLFYNSNPVKIRFPATLTYIPDYMFLGAKNLSGIQLPDTVKSIGESAFQGSDIEEIKLPNGLETIGIGAFASCMSLKNIKIPSSVKSIDMSAFYRSENLESVNIPYGITEVAEFAFCDCKSLKSVNIPDGIKNIGNNAFSNTAVSSFDLPDGVVSIGREAFSGVKATIKVPDTVTYVGEKAFDASSAVIYGNRGTTIHNYALQNSIRFIATDTIGIVAVPKKTMYIQDEDFLKEDMVVTAFFADGTSEEVTLYTLSGYDSTIGTQKITITYYNYSATYDINVTEKKLTDLTVDKQREHYYERNSFSKDMFEVTACYNNGKKEVVTDYEISGFDTSTAGTKTITVKYMDMQMTFELEVEHVWGSYTSNKYNDCVNNGAKIYTCQYCRGTKSEPIAPRGHKFSNTFTIDKEATCTEDGVQSRHCEYCNEKTEVSVLKATGHTYKSEVVKVPTCTEKGELKNTCHCGDVQIVLLPEIHTVVIDKAVAPSCTKTGLTEGSHCSECGTVIIEQKVVPMSEHTAKGDWVITKEPTATEKGIRVKYCSFCKSVVEEEYFKDVCQHVVVIQEGVAPTCVTAGYTDAKYCSVCGEMLVNHQIIPATGHTEVIDKGYAATCIEKGLSDGKHCSVCNEVLISQRELPAAGNHCEVIEKGVLPTCTTAGYTDAKYCSLCDEILATHQIIPATGHTEEIKKAIMPTCTETGLTEGKYCSVCNEVFVAQEKIRALGHKEVVDKAVAPTCTETGLTEGKHCSVCDEVLVAQETINATGHITKTVGKKSSTYFAKGHTGKTVCKDCGVVISKGKSTPILKLKTPTAKYTGGKKKLTVRCTKVKDATGFQVKYKIGKKSITKIYNTKKSATKTLKNLKKGTYKVQVRAFVKSGTKKAYSSWNKAKSVKVK